MAGEIVVIVLAVIAGIMAVCVGVWVSKNRFRKKDNQHHAEKGGGFEEGVELEKNTKPDEQPMRL